MSKVYLRYKSTRGHVMSAVCEEKVCLTHNTRTFEVLNVKCAFATWNVDVTNGLVFRWADTKQGKTRKMTIGHVQDLKNDICIVDPKMDCTVPSKAGSFQVWYQASHPVDPPTEIP